MIIESRHNLLGNADITLRSLLRLKRWYIQILLHCVGKKWPKVFST